MTILVSSLHFKFSLATQYENSVQGLDSVVNKSDRRRHRASSSESSGYSRRIRRSRSSSLEEKYDKIKYKQKDNLDRSESKRPYDDDGALSDNYNFKPAIEIPPAPVLNPTSTRTIYKEDFKLQSVIEVDMTKKLFTPSSISYKITLHVNDSENLNEKIISTLESAVDNVASIIKSNEVNNPSQLVIIRLVYLPLPFNNQPSNEPNNYPIEEIRSAFVGLPVSVRPNEPYRLSSDLKSTVKE